MAKRTQRFFVDVVVPVEGKRSDVIGTRLVVATSRKAATKHAKRLIESLWYEVESVPRVKGERA